MSIFVVESKSEQAQRLSHWNHIFLTQVTHYATQNTFCRFGCVLSTRRKKESGVVKIYTCIFTRTTICTLWFQHFPTWSTFQYVCTCTVYPRIKTCTFCRRKKPVSVYLYFYRWFCCRTSSAWRRKKRPPPKLCIVRKRRQKKTTRDLHKLLRNIAQLFTQKRETFARSLPGLTNWQREDEEEEENVSARKTDRNVVNRLGFFFFQIAEKEG